MLRTKLAGAVVAAAALAAGFAAPAQAASGYIEIIAGTQDEILYDPSGCLSIATTGPDVKLTIVNHTDQTIRLYSLSVCSSGETPAELAPGDSLTGSFTSIWTPLT